MNVGTIVRKNPKVWNHGCDKLGVVTSITPKTGGMYVLWLQGKRKGVEVFYNIGDWVVVTG